MEYLGLNEINGSLVTLEGVENPVYEEIVKLKSRGRADKTGRVARIDGDRVVIQVFQGTEDLSLK
ncbi:MAG: V-type ATP synthase subunit B, partial [Clostridiales bacterium]|nr:V-type ATP synthase subunit B [Clostridiales bacterium]